MASSKKPSSSADSGVLRSGPAVSLERWDFILDTLVGKGLISSVDPRNHVGELRDIGCLSRQEWDKIDAEKTKDFRMHKLETFLRIRPSMFGVLRNILSKANKPLLNVMEEASTLLNQQMCKNTERLKKALLTLQPKLKVLGEWAATEMRTWECLLPEETTELIEKRVSLCDLLTDKRAASHRWPQFFSFLEKEQPDFLLFVDRAYFKRSESDNMEKVKDSERKVRDVEDKLKSHEEEIAALKEGVQRLSGMGRQTKSSQHPPPPPPPREPRPFRLYNGTSTGPFRGEVKNVSLLVPEAATVEDVRAAVAELLGREARDTEIQQRVGVFDGARVLDASDGRNYIYTSEDGKRTVQLRDVDNWEWKSLTHDAAAFVLPPGRRLHLRAFNR